VANKDQEYQIIQGAQAAAVMPTVVKNKRATHSAGDSRGDSFMRKKLCYQKAGAKQILDDEERADAMAFNDPDDLIFMSTQVDPTDNHRDLAVKQVSENTDVWVSEEEDDDDSDDDTDHNNAPIFMAERIRVQPVGTSRSLLTTMIQQARSGATRPAPIQAPELDEALELAPVSPRSASSSVRELFGPVARASRPAVSPSVIIDPLHAHPVQLSVPNGASSLEYLQMRRKSAPHAFRIASKRASAPPNNTPVVNQLHNHNANDDFNGNSSRNPHSTRNPHSYPPLLTPSRTRRHFVHTEWSPPLRESILMSRRQKSWPDLPTRWSGKAQREEWRENGRKDLDDTFDFLLSPQVW
jgi:hypothetical protein